MAKCQAPGTFVYSLDTSRQEWQILTPDFDRYSEQLDHLNPDYADFIYLGASTNIPPRVPAHEIYGFAPMDPATLANHIHGLKPMQRD